MEAGHDPEKSNEEEEEEASDGNNRQQVNADDTMVTMSSAAVLGRSRAYSLSSLAVSGHCACHSCQLKQLGPLSRPAKFTKAVTTASN